MEDPEELKDDQKSVIFFGTWISSDSTSVHLTLSSSIESIQVWPGLWSAEGWLSSTDLLQHHRIWTHWAIQQATCLRHVDPGLGFGNLCCETHESMKWWRALTCAWVEWVEATLSTWGNGWFNESLGSLTVGVPLFSTVQLGVISRFDRRAWWCSHEDRALTLWPDCWIAWSRILRVCGYPASAHGRISCFLEHLAAFQPCYWRVVKYNHCLQ